MPSLGLLTEEDKHQLRCFCAHEPLLAVYGRDTKGRVFVHVRIYKGRRVYHESVHYNGEVQIMCRDCFRWHRIAFVKETDLVRLEETQRPEELEPLGDAASR